MSPTMTNQTTTDFSIRAVRWDEHSAPLSAIRRDVFIDEQNVPEDMEWDGEDRFAQHWLALADHQAVGTVRLLRNGHVGRMAVLQPWRHRGVGSALLKAVIAEAFAQNLRELFQHAQTHALDFYARHGFVAEGPEFMDAGIPHRTMRLAIRTHRTLGQDAGRFAVTSPNDVALDLANQAQRHLRIFSSALDPAIYDRAEMADALSRLVRNYRAADIRILIVDSSRLAQTSHALVSLAKRLSSAIRIRRLDMPDGSLAENYLVADGCGLLCQSLRDPDLAWADYNNRPLANDYAQQFDELWNHAHDDPNLRNLHL
jgi:predicted GNAT family N-acyltransferase